MTSTLCQNGWCLLVEKLKTLRSSDYPINVQILLACGTNTSTLLKVMLSIPWHPINLYGGIELHGLSISLHRDWTSKILFAIPHLIFLLHADENPNQITFGAFWQKVVYHVRHFWHIVGSFKNRGFCKGDNQIIQMMLNRESKDWHLSLFQKLR